MYIHTCVISLSHVTQSRHSVMSLSRVTQPCTQRTVMYAVDEGLRGQNVVQSVVADWICYVRMCYVTQYCDVSQCWHVTQYCHVTQYWHVTQYCHATQYCDVTQYWHVTQYYSVLWCHSVLSCFQQVSMPTVTFSDMSYSGCVVLLFSWQFVYVRINLTLSKSCWVFLRKSTNNTER